MTDFKTRSGYIVTLKDDLTYSQFLELQKIYTGSAEFDFATKTIKRIDPSVAVVAQEKAIEFLVVKVITPDGNTATDAVQAVKDMPRKDGMEVGEEINRITQTGTTPKKN